MATAAFKNPFEIRTDILQMAKDYMDSQYQLNVEYSKKMIEESLKQGKEVTESVQKFAPDLYTIDDWLKNAQKLYGFVSKKD